MTKIALFQNNSSSPTLSFAVKVQVSTYIFVCVVLCEIMVATAHASYVWRLWRFRHLPYLTWTPGPVVLRGAWAVSLRDIVWFPQQTLPLIEAGNHEVKQETFVSRKCPAYNTNKCWVERNIRRGINSLIIPQKGEYPFKFYQTILNIVVAAVTLFLSLLQTSMRFSFLCFILSFLYRYPLCFP